jgi:UDP-N-acetylmuramate: L-alanyl-gamma-D-glutamyl-meso-diaminopimelate ligase
MRSEALEYYNKKLQNFPDKEMRVFARVMPKKESIQKIHLTGVCGTAMGALSGLLAEAGYKVSGSDEGCYPPMSTLINELGIEFKEGFKAEHIQDADAVIIGNVSRPDNEEARYAREHALPTFSLPEAIRELFIADKRSLVVAGTHGKTTTTGMLAHVFQNAGLDPAYMVGGVLQNYGRSFRLGKGRHFIIEGDEYDTAYFDKSPKFLHYMPTSLIVTSLELDHTDIYKNIEEYRKAFEFLVKEIPGTETLFLYGDTEETRSLALQAVCDVQYYGFEERNDIRALDIAITPEGQQFELHVDGEKMGELFVPLHGKHNILNTLAVCGVALKEGLSMTQLRQGLKTFKGIKRRQEIVGEKKGITVIDDFAHHPTAVRETIKAIREQFPERRLVVFFEPRSNTSRRKIFEEEYGKALGQADISYLSIPSFRHNDKAEDFIDPAKVIEGIKQNGSDAYAVANAGELLELALPKLAEGDVVLIMSNGSFDGIHAKLLSLL